LFQINVIVIEYQFDFSLFPYRCLSNVFLPFFSSFHWHHRNSNWAECQRRDIYLLYNLTVNHFIDNKHSIVELHIIIKKREYFANFVMMTVMITLIDEMKISIKLFAVSDLFNIFHSSFLSTLENERTRNDMLIK
jgi:hypothetical protein